MIITDTHTHLYLQEFDKDRNQVIENAINAGVRYMLLPNIDSKSIDGMLAVCDSFPNNCFPMIGLHPTNVDTNFLMELENVERWLSKRKFIAVGEIGIDLYWDKTHKGEQIDAFKFQIELAKKNDLPIVIHSRESMAEIISILEEVNSDNLRGVFHCFNGTLVEAKRVIEMGFLLGIGGVVTFKNSGLDQIVSAIDLAKIVLETDSPYLTPAPFRGKRNESAYTTLVNQKMAEIKDITIEEVATITSNNARKLFKF
ncbi:MAG: TatD family hydrolase [Bacteroidetes bacterium]|nr:TatD family hydrolase [Bacteroidota bacterium]